MKAIWSDDFDRQARKLARKHRQIIDDIEFFLAELDAGDTPGRRMTGVGGRPVYWARIRDRSSRRGKSGGFRIVYFRDHEVVILLMIGVRSDFGSVDPRLVMQVLRDNGIK